MVKQPGHFKVEDVTSFPLDYHRFPNVIDKIFSYLTCEEQFNARLAFNNLDKHTDRPPVISAVQPKKRTKISDVVAKKCVCQTHAFNDPSIIRDNGKLARVIYNQMLSFTPTKQSRIEVHINDSQRCDHVPEVKYQYEGLEYQYTAVSINAWIYNVTTLSVQYIQQHSSADLPPVKSKRKRVYFHPHSERWKDEDQWFF